MVDCIIQIKAILRLRNQMFLESFAVQSISTTTLKLNKGPFPTVTPEMKRTQ